MPTPHPLADALLSVEQVAEILKLNVRTVRNYVRRGTLKATRIGKQYRVGLGDLEAFTGRPVESHDERVLGAGGRVDVSTVINIEGVTAALAGRMTSTLMATANVLRSIEQPVAVSTAYEEQRDRLRVLIAADLKSTRNFLAMIDAVLEQPASSAGQSG
jgi:excisionase family DNA binding protein